MSKKWQDLWNYIQDMRQHFGWDKSDTDTYLVNNIVDEALELKEAFEQKDEQSMAKECADIWIVLLTLCHEKGWDPDQIIPSKIKEIMSRTYD